MTPTASADLVDVLIADLLARGAVTPAGIDKVRGALALAHARGVVDGLQHLIRAQEVLCAAAH